MARATEGIGKVLVAYRYARPAPIGMHESSEPEHGFFVASPGAGLVIRSLLVTSDRTATAYAVVEGDADSLRELA